MLSATIWTIVVVLFVLWLLGIIFNVVPALAWILLAIAIIVAIIRLVTGRRPVV
ncbi:MAG TPA: DUF5670 family protein [Gemmatimonadaceae bacterium]|nr:DUF5670 family protein [Gemmatimonadaceae bacterium]